MIPIRAVVVFLIVLSQVFIFLYPKSQNQITETIKGATFQQESTVSATPQPNDNWQIASEISAKSAVVIDNATGIPLYEKNSKMRHLPASTTKLATALTALETCDLLQNVTVASLETTPNQMGLAQGDTVTVQSLLYGLLITSGNDAAYALADSCSSGINQFVLQMNKLVKRLGMIDTHLTNPAGFDQSANYTTAEDLAKLARAAVANPLIAQIVATKSSVVTDARGIKPYYLENINKLLWEVNGIEGVKTGQTEGAQENLIAQTTRGGNTIITVVLGSEDRFSDSKQLIEWTFQNYHWTSP